MDRQKQITKRNQLKKFLQQFAATGNSMKTYTGGKKIKKTRKIRKTRKTKNKRTRRK
jgi:hypothetical protein